MMIELLQELSAAAATHTLHPPPLPPHTHPPHTLTHSLTHSRRFQCCLLSLSSRQKQRIFVHMGQRKEEERGASRRGRDPSQIPRQQQWHLSSSEVTHELPFE